MRLILLSRFSLPFGASPASMIEWIHNVGGFVSPKLQVESDPLKGRGLFVNEPVRAGETLVLIPLKAILLGEQAIVAAPCSERFRDFFDTSRSPENVRPHAIFSMIVLLLAILADPSRLESPHVDELLRWRGQARFPLFWSQEQLDEITGTTALEAFSVAAKGVEREYTEVLSKLCPQVAATCDLPTYKRIWALVNSRVLTVPASLHHGLLYPQPALVPMFDLANHHLVPPEKTLLTEESVRKHLSTSLGRFDFDSRGLRLWLKDSIEAGDQVTDVYGLQSNQETLWAYGFTVPWIHNMTCLTKTRLIIKVQDLWLGALSRSLQAFEAVPFTLSGCTSPNDINDALAFLRISMASSRATLQQLQKTCFLDVPDAFGGLLQLSTLGSTWHLGSCKYLNQKDELVVLQKLMHLVDEKLLQMRPNAANDEGLLKKTPQELPPTLRDAITIRHDEKVLLQRVRKQLRRLRKPLGRAREGTF